MQAIVVLDTSKLNIRWEEPYVSHGLNRKLLSSPSGAYRGLWFDTNGTSTLQIVPDPDSLGMELQHFGIVEDRTNGYGVSFRDADPIEVDCSALLTGGAAQTFYVWLEMAYLVSSATTGNVVLSNVPGDVPSDSYLFLGTIAVDAGATTLDEGTNCTFDYADATFPRMTPQPTMVDAHGDYAAGDKQWGFIEGQERRNLPNNDEKDAMSGAASPSASNPFAVLVGFNLHPFVVDLSAYGSPATAIKGIAKGPGNGVHGVGDNGFGGFFEGGDAIVASNGNGMAGAVGVGGTGDGTGDGGAGGAFTGGEGGATGDGGVGVYAEGYGVSIAVDPGNKGVIGLGGGTDGHGGFFVGSYGDPGGIGVEGWGGDPSDGGSGRIGVKGVGSDSTTGGSGGAGVYGQGGAKFGSAWAGPGGSFKGGDSDGAGVLALGFGATYVAFGGEPVGIWAKGGADTTGIVVFGGDGDSSGLKGFGKGTGVGVAGMGSGGTSTIPVLAEGAGVYGAGTSVGAHGAYFQGADGWAGVRAYGGSGTGGNASGGVFTGGNTSSKGVVGIGGGGSPSAGTLPVGVVGYGGDGGAGVKGYGGDSDSVGVFGYGGGTDGYGGSFLGQGDGIGLLARGYGAIDPEFEWMFGAGLLAMGADDKYGAIAIGGDDDGIGMYCEGGANAPGLKIASRSSAPTVMDEGCVTCDNYGDLQYARGGEYRYIGCQAWGKCTTTGTTGAQTFDGSGGIELGFSGVALNGSYLRFTFELDFTNEDSFVAIPAYVGTGPGIVRIHAQTASYVDVALFDDTGALIPLGANVETISVAAFGR